MPNTATVNFLLNEEILFKHSTNEVVTYVKPKSIDIPIEKRWTNENGNTSLRKDIKLQLQKKTDSDENWQNVEDKSYFISSTATDEKLKSTFTSLPTYEDNKAIEYRVVEVFDRDETSVPGYKAPVCSDENGTKIVTNELLTTNLNFTKVNEKKQPLSNVIFKLTKNDQNPQTVTTGEDGKVSFESLTLGHYTLEETKTANGYELGQNGKISWEFEVKQNGDTLFISWENGSPLDENANFINKHKLYNLNFTKIDDQQNPLKGAEFELKDINNNVIPLENSNNDSKFIAKNLLPGEYTLTEIRAPQGYYKLEKSVSFKIDDSGELSSDSKILTNIEISDNTISFNVPNKPKVPLPATGGIGVWLIYGAGITALIVGVGYYFLRNKSKGEA